MIPGISTATINPYNLQDPELIQCLEQQNKGIGLEILGIKLLQRKLDDNTDTFSLIIFLPRQTWPIEPSNMGSTTTTNASTLWKNTLPNCNSSNAITAHNSGIMLQNVKVPILHAANAADTI
jgi:hypothetical protein